MTKSISDDDLCATCRHCTIPATATHSHNCLRDWPGTVNADGYIVDCPEFAQRGTYTEPAARIERFAAESHHGVSACVGFSLSGFISLGYDKREKVTPERLAKAVQENVLRYLNDLGADALAELIDAVHVEQLTDE